MFYPLWHGSVSHHRLKPKSHGFCYAHLSLLLDLSRVEETLEQLGVAYNRRAISSWRDCDYGCRQLSLPLDTQMQALLCYARQFDRVVFLSEQDACEVIKSSFAEQANKKYTIRQLSQPRRLGVLLNPLTCYFCYDAKGALCYLVLEVTNTPWGERSFYCIPADREQSSAQFSKQMHVSPFMPMDLEYRCDWNISTKKIVVSLDLLQAEERIFSATLKLIPVRGAWPVGHVNSKAYERYKRHYILFNYKIVARIYYHALLLFLKRVTFYAHPKGKNKSSAYYHINKKTKKNGLGMSFMGQSNNKQNNHTDAQGGGFMSSFYRKQVLERVKKFKFGNILWQDGVSNIQLNHDNSLPVVKVLVKNMQAYKLIARHGSIGLGESYAKGYWETSDLTQLLTNLALNIEQINQDDKSNWLYRLVLRLYQFKTRNTKRQAKYNIQQHYDLGNAFFSLFLDPSMQYSCLLYQSPQQSIEQAANNKTAQLLKLLHLSPGQSVLEIGCGWGSLSLAMAREYGAQVTALTLSQEQFDAVKKQVKQHSMESKITVLLEDYRSFSARTQQKFDRIVSVEMIEAVGYKYMPQYFSVVDKLLKKDGLFVLQAITIRDQHFKAANREIDFIKRYIFPGGFLPSVERIMHCSQRHTDLNLLALQDYATSYHHTLGDWSKRLHKNSKRAQAMGYDMEFQRLWQFYLSYCQAGFAINHTGVVQAVFCGKSYNKSQRHSASMPVYPKCVDA